ncbi:hypothetical protein FOZ62_023322 [Perkinsus olseni]|uniref:Uncharacterized protein n=1 Tax=Perkinsus olseni TaxID=32597 RepID=A0A7J6QYQ3_PEROL|nr:hypothetical protein FOZ62_023322 [Perkinsus olseni]
MTRLLVIFATVTGTLSIQADPLINKTVANFTALLGNPDVHKFIDKVVMDAPRPPSLDHREKGEALEGQVVGSKQDDYPFCSNCKTIHSTAISAYFQQQVTNICQGCQNVDSPSVDAFCYFMREGIPELNQVLNGYIFVRSRALQLAISTCIGRVQCPTKDAYNAFFNPIVPGRLVDFTRFDLCYANYRSTRDIGLCFAIVTTKMLLFAYNEVLVACNEYVAEGLDEFCGYIATDVGFGVGLVFGYVGVYEQATGYCVRDRCN